MLKAPLNPSNRSEITEPLLCKEETTTASTYLSSVEQGIVRYFLGDVVN